MVILAGVSLVAATPSLTSGGAARSAEMSVTTSSWYLPLIDSGGPG